MPQTLKPFSFGPLEHYTAEEVLLWNACCRCLPSPSEWKTAIEWVFSRTLERCGGHILKLFQDHSLEPSSGTHEITFEKSDISLGRNPENDVLLPANSVSKQHARILIREGRCYLEDLGSRMGTFINKKRLGGNEPVLLSAGDQFSLFPYHFTFALQKIWLPETSIQFSMESWRLADVETFQASGSIGESLFGIELHPVSKVMVVRVGDKWVEELLRRLLPRLETESTSIPWDPAAENGFLEFLLLSILDRVQQKTVFPFHFSLRRSDDVSAMHGVRGMMSTVTLGLPETTGLFRIFIPMDLIRSIQHLLPRREEYALPGSIVWPFNFSLGHVELTLAELREIEKGDVVLFLENSELLFPHPLSRGWSGSLEKAESWSFHVERYFERSWRMESKSDPELKNADGEKTQKPRFDDLPILLHVVLGEKEMTLAQANHLIPGSIVELETRQGDAVGLAVNGKQVGKGELVDVDGKLGVRILEWRAP
jgi:type III secretion system YscQ/HrcQ family protein